MNVSRAVIRSFSATASRSIDKNTPLHPNYHKIKETYKKFQVDNGLLVHQRGGTKDTVLYAITISVIAVGLGLCGQAYYKMIFKPK